MRSAKQPARTVTATSRRLQALARRPGLFDAQGHPATIRLEDLVAPEKRRDRRARARPRKANPRAVGLPRATLAALSRRLYAGLQTAGPGAAIGPATALTGQCLGRRRGRRRGSLFGRPGYGLCRRRIRTFGRRVFRRRCRVSRALPLWRPRGPCGGRQRGHADLFGGCRRRGIAALRRRNAGRQKGQHHRGKGEAKQAGHRSGHAGADVGTRPHPARLRKGFQ